MCFMLVSLNCFGDVKYSKLNWSQPQNFQYPIIGNIRWKPIVVKDTVSQEIANFEFENIKAYYDVLQYKQISNNRVLVYYVVEKIIDYSAEVYDIIAENPIEFGLYYRDNAKNCFIGGAVVYMSSLAILITGGLCQELSYKGRIAMMSVGGSLAASATATYIAGIVYQTRSNRLFLVGCSNYGISATYKF